MNPTERLTPLEDQRTATPPRHDTAEPPEAEESRHSKWWLWLVILIGIGTGAWFALRHTSNSAAAGGAKPRGAPPTPVVAATARKGDIGVFFTGLGAVTPLNTVTIRSRIDGQLLAVHYREGQIVRQGDPLVEIDPKPYRVQLTQAEGQLLKDQATLHNAETDLARYQTLLAKNAVAEQVVATQKATVEQSQGNIRTDQGNIESAKLNLFYCRINAPIGGRLGLRLVDAGNMVSANANTALAVITQVDPISVIFTIPEEQLPAVLKRLRAGNKLPVDALARDLHTTLATGQLSTLDNQIDPTTGTVKLRATFNNHDGMLFPNQFVNARMLVEEKKGMTLVPNAAVQRSTSAVFVYLVKPDQSVTVRNVVVGTVNEQDSEITSGLAPGDVVVTQGVDKLQEGSKVVAQVQGAGNPSAGAQDSAGTRPTGNAEPSGAGQSGSQPNGRNKKK